MANELHYVKFVRGTYNSWANLNQKDNDTLYFIYDGNDSSKGLLYLGNKLISGSDNQAIDIADLANVSIDALANKQLLAYNGNTGEWENTSLADIISVSDLSVATSTSAGLMPALPAENGANKFLRGDGTWAEISLDSMSRQVVAREEDLYDLLDNGEIQENVIYMVPNGSNGDNKYDEYLLVEDNGEQQLERVGTLGDVDLSGYVTTAEIGNLTQLLNQQQANDLVTIIQGQISDISNLQSAVTNLQSVTSNVITTDSFDTILQGKIGNLDELLISTENEDETLVGEVNAINNRLKWHELANN